MPVVYNANNRWMKMKYYVSKQRVKWHRVIHVDTVPVQVVGRNTAFSCRVLGWPKCLVPDSIRRVDTRCIH